MRRTGYPEQAERAPAQFEDEIGTRAAEWLRTINANRTARGKPSLTPAEWDAYSVNAREYQDSDDPEVRARAMDWLKRLNGDPEGIQGLGIPESIRAQVGLA